MKLNTNSTGRGYILLLASLVFACQINNDKRNRGLVADSAMVVTAHPLASQVGVTILKKGGNAIDAAIAVQFALAVVFPAAGNIGGGGFIGSRPKKVGGFSLFYREKNPS